MSTTSARLGILIAALTDAADAHVLANAIVSVIDPIMAEDFQGTFSARPAAGTVAGKYYYATDTGAIYRSDGTTWQLINPYPTTDAIPATGSLRTLGTGAQQAAAGNDSRFLVPVGTIIHFAGTGTPSPGSWQACDGSSQLRAGAYATLFGIIGVTYGSVDGTHFTMPDSRGRTFIGTGTGAGLTARAAGAVVSNEESHALSAGESGLPAHTHATDSQGSHQHSPFGAGQAFYTTAAVDGTLGSAGAGALGYAFHTDFQGAHTHTALANATAAGSAHNNMQPSLAIPAWIRYA